MIRLLPLLIMVGFQEYIFMLRGNALARRQSSSERCGLMPFVTPSTTKQSAIFVLTADVVGRSNVSHHSKRKNTKHRPYPRDFNFTPMLHHLTKDLDTLVPTFRARCANVTIQQWRTMDPMEHGSSSPTLCLPSAPYHDTITPGRYACMASNSCQNEKKLHCVYFIYFIFYFYFYF